MPEILQGLHGDFVHRRRVRVLADWIAPWLAGASTAIDVGCGDGKLSEILAQRVPSCRIEGYELKPRPGSVIKVSSFDGRVLPLGAASVDDVLLIDVLHHAEDPFVLLSEACRVARRQVIIKDHRLGKKGAWFLLAAMDWAGNRSFDVKRPHHYWAEKRWREAWRELGWAPADYQTSLGMYPRPFSALFDDGLQFLARLTRGEAR